MTDWRAIDRGLAAMRVGFVACAVALGAHATVTMTTRDRDPPSLLPWVACLLAIATAAVSGVGAEGIARHVPHGRRAGRVAVGCAAGVAGLEQWHVFAGSATGNVLDGAAMLLGLVALVAMLDAVRWTARLADRDDLGRGAWHTGAALLATFGLLLVTPSSYSASMTTTCAFALELALAAVVIGRVGRACRDRAEQLPRATVV